MKRSFILSLLIVIFFTLIPVSGVKADNGFATVTVDYTGDGVTNPTPGDNGCQGDCRPTPPKKEYCTTTLEDKLDAEGNKIIVNGVVQQKEITTCEFKNDKDWTAYQHNSGIAQWTENEIFPEQIGQNGSFSLRLNGPSINAPGVSKFYAAECESPYRKAYPGTFLGFEGIYQPLGVRWNSIQAWYVDENYEQQAGTLYVDYLSDAEGGCVWPAVKNHSARCPVSAENAYGDGPFGEGLPVQIGPNPTDMDPLSKPARRGPLDVISGPDRGTKKAYTDFGRTVYLLRQKLSDEEMITLVTNCNERVTQTFGMELRHAGQYYVSAVGTHVWCSYLSFNGPSKTFYKFIKCGDKENRGVVEPSWQDCEGTLHPNEDILNNPALANYDFSCRDKKPVVEVVCSTPNPACPTIVRIPEPLENPSDPGVLIPVPEPGADTIICRWDYPTVKPPKTNKDLPTLNKAYTLGATGERWRLDWGNLSVENAPNIQNEWTDYFVESGSTPGNTDEKASDDAQPFRGEYNNRGVLMWDDPELNDTGEGISKADWAQTLDMNWYRAGLQGVSEESLYTVYQERNFTWQENLPQQNWDGSWTDGSQLIHVNCLGPSASFIVVGGRNTSGNTLGR